MPHQQNTASNRQLAEKHEGLVLVHYVEGKSELEPYGGEVGSQGSLLFPKTKFFIKGDI